MRLFNKNKKLSQNHVASHTTLSPTATTAATTTTFPSLYPTMSIDETNQKVQEEFLDAAHKGQLDKVKECINQGIDVEVKDNQGRTALHRAVYEGHLDVVRYLMKACHVDMEAKDKDGRTALHYASDSGRLESHRYLVEKCHVNREARDNYGGTALHRASRNGHLTIVRYLIEECNVNKEAKNNDGWTALHNASRYGYFDMIRYLAEQGHVNMEATSNDGQTALHFASFYGYLDIVQYLIKTCNVDSKSKDNDGKTAYDLALNRRRNDVTQYLLRVQSETTAKTGTWYPNMTSETQIELIQQFIIAVQEGNLGQVQECINKGMDVEVKDHDGWWTALHRASLNGHLNIVQYLIERGIDKETRSKDGMMALHCACKNGHLNIVQYFIEIYHVNTDERDNDGTTALHYASKYGHLNIVQYLLVECHVDTEAKDVYGSTALMLASQRDHMNIVQYLVEQGNANAEAAGNDGWTALHCTSFNGYLDIAHYLIEICGVDREAKDMYGSTALHLACQRGRLKVVQQLIESCHVNKEAIDNNGWTALHYASSNGRLDVVQYLIRTCQVNVDAKNNDGETAHELSRESDVVEYLNQVRTANKSSNINIDKQQQPLSLNNVQQQREPEETRQTIDTASPYQKMSPDEQKKFVLEFIDAAKEGNLDKINECINQGVNVEAKNKNGITALHRACGNGQLDVVRFLAKDCHTNVEIKTNDGRTALHDACSNGNLDVVKYLIQTCHVNTKTKDNDGWTALHFASRYGYLDIIQLLIQQCNVDLEAENNAGETAYDLARKTDIIEYFDHFIADTNAPTKESNEKQQSVLARIGNKDEATFKSAQLLAKVPFNDGELFNATRNERKVAQSPLIDSERRTANDWINDSSDPHKETWNMYGLNEAWISDLMMSLQSDNQKLIQMLDQISNSIQFIDERRDILDLIIVEKCNTIEEQEEQSAILASSLHRDFYLLLQRKLKCMVKSCETLSSGMVGIGGGDLRSFTARTIREKGCNVLEETRLGFFIGNAVQWAKKNLAVVPFVDTIGSVFQLVITLKDDRDRYVGLARVADFSTLVCLQQHGTPSLDVVVEKFARLIVRARCALPSCKFVEEKDEFGRFKQLLLHLLADSGDTPAKEQASIAADCAFAHIMKPNNDSVLFDVLHGDGFDFSLHEALAATVLGITLEDLKKLDPFTLTSPAATLPNNDTAENVIIADASNKFLNDTSVTSASTTLNGSNFASSDLVAEQEAKIQKQDEMIRQLSHQVARLEKASKQSNSRVDYDAGGGLMYANPTEQFKNEITGIQTENVTLDRRLCDQATILDELRSQVRDLQKELQIQRGYR